MDTTVDFKLPLVPAPLRLGVAVVVALVLALAWLTAERESRDAVIVAGTNIRTTHILLPAVEIIGRRGAAGAHA